MGTHLDAMVRRTRRTRLGIWLVGRADIWLPRGIALGSRRLLALHQLLELHFEISSCPPRCKNGFSPRLSLRANFLQLVLLRVLVLLERKRKSRGRRVRWDLLPVFRSARMGC